MKVTQLQEIGLQHKESLVYFAGLKLGPTSIAALAKGAGLNRTSVHAIVKKLMGKGLFALQIGNTMTCYEAMPPERLKPIAEQKTAKVIRGFQTLFERTRHPSDPEDITYFRGVEGLKNASDFVLSELHTHDYYYVVGETRRWLQSDEHFFLQFMKRRARMNLDLRLLLTDTQQGRFNKKFERNFNANVRLLNSTIALDMNLVIVPERIMLQKMTEPLTTVVIHNRETSDIMKTIFQILWEAI